MMENVEVATKVSDKKAQTEDKTTYYQRFDLMTPPSEEALHGSKFYYLGCIPLSQDTIHVDSQFLSVKRIDISGTNHMLIKKEQIGTLQEQSTNCYGQLSLWALVKLFSLLFCSFLVLDSKIEQN
jgi:hypothetical protein